MVNTNHDFKKCVLLPLPPVGLRNVAIFIQHQTDEDVHGPLYSHNIIYLPRSRTSLFVVKVLVIQKGILKQIYEYCGCICIRGIKFRGSYIPEKCHFRGFLNSSFLIF